MRSTALTVLSCMFLGLSVCVAHAAPINDDFGNGTVLSGYATSVLGSTYGSTKEANEPNHAGNLTPATVWYVWQAAADGVVSVDAASRDNDMVLAVYTGDAVNALTETASTTVTAANTGLTFRATKGTTYRLVACGLWAGVRGDAAFRLGMSLVPDNDSFADAERLVSGDGRVALAEENTNCTTQSAEPTLIDGARFGATAWYAWESTRTGPVQIDTQYSDFDTVLGVYRGTSVGALAKVADNDDAYGPASVSMVRFVATAGETYRIQVGGTYSISGIRPVAVSTPQQGALHLHVTPVVASPVFTPAEGTIAVPADITISCATTGATVRYTLDGRDPTETSTVYAAPISLSAGAVVKAKALRDRFLDSAVVTAGYTAKPQKPTFAPVPGTYTYPLKVRLRCATPGAVICYTVDGRDPTEASRVYRTPIALSATTLVKARAFKAGWTASDMARGAFKVRCLVTRPMISPGTPRALQVFSVRGFVSPRVGSATWIYVEKKTSGSFRLYRRLPATNSPFSTYTSYLLPKLVLRTGAYRIQARYADRTHAPAVSPYRFLTIR